MKNLLLTTLCIAGLNACAAPITNHNPADTAAIPVPYMPPPPKIKPMLEAGEMIYSVFDYKITQNDNWATKLADPAMLAELLSEEYSYNFLKRQILPLPKDSSADDRCENFKVQQENTSLQQYLNRYGLNVADLQLTPPYNNPEPVTGKPGTRPEPIPQNMAMVKDGRFSNSGIYDFSRGAIHFKDQPVQVFRTDCPLKQFRETVIIPRMEVEHGKSAEPVLLTHIDGVFFYSTQPQ